ncbi:glycogen phosphorylase family protein [Burkholderia lata]|uniref:Alpha-1,4 glucan phosphorylase n=1 Tax=Burkholderia lata (strain ATCC 17760 / DSM 23089 / LMG 22485 / NCIMB 9086 / R18194 / 383) TaxID=482957 RepID=A0A6P2SHN0_BURL3|nr:glycogen/starch/alpha-glucan phosphorylase [Burkholderia lata]VWC47547.1 glycogen phosphorylase family protein [Burkholderia lata]
MQDTQRAASRSGVESLREDILAELRYGFGKTLAQASLGDLFHALALAVRKRLVDGWLDTQARYDAGATKRVYYLSMEFLMGQSLASNLIALGMLDTARAALESLDVAWRTVADAEYDAALGNGGLGRLAACFVESLASLGLPGYGCGIKYEYGLFRQQIDNLEQTERPDLWHSDSSPWLIERTDETRYIPLYGRIEHARDADGQYNPMWLDWKMIAGVPHDMLIPGYGGHTVNALRLYAARASDTFDMRIFNSGDYVRAVEEKIASETVSKVLYPADDSHAGKELRLVQEYFLVACSLRDILVTFEKSRLPIERLAERVAIQMNDTHPALAVTELMRILVDEHRTPWEVAWNVTRSTCAYTNHTLLPEALETWPVDLLERVLPRHLQILYEINRRFLDEVAARWPNDTERMRRMSLIDESAPRRVRMAHLAIVGSHSINGVAELHSKLVCSHLVPDFHALYPERFNNKTNGVTVRRWIVQSNPALAALFGELLDGDGWITELDRLRGLERFLDDGEVHARLRGIKRSNKEHLADLIREQLRFSVDPDAMFDVQVKRIHEYKRQLLNILHVMHLYLHLVEDGGEIAPRVVVFSGKAAPGYAMAKLIIHLIATVADHINRDPRANQRLRVAFLPDYKVSLAERIIPAADLSEQISTAGMEASGTGNMKLAMNGALTIGTLDGANIEIREAVGAENFYMFGLTAAEIATARASGSYDSRACYASDPSIRRVLNAMLSGRFGNGDDRFRPIFDSLLIGGDYYFHLADFAGYIESQARAAQDFSDKTAWMRRVVANVARLGRFSSDHTIAEYARDIWHIEPAPARRP